MDRITLSSMRYAGLLGASEEERAFPHLIAVDLVIGRRPSPRPAISIFAGAAIEPAFP